jgi:peroxiredoxin
MPTKALLGLIACLVAALGYTIYDTLEAPPAQVGAAAPGFEIKDRNGRVYTPRDFGGKLLILNFWATWCPPCVDETPRLSRLQEILAKDGVVVLAVSIDKKEETYTKFVDRFQVKFATAWDPDARISASFGTFRFPETYVINREGKVVATYTEGEPEGTWLAPHVIDSIRGML